VEEFILIVGIAICLFVFGRELLCWYFKYNRVVVLLEEKLGKAVNLYDEPQIVGALGAALLARRDA